MNPILRVLRMATESTDRRYWMAIFLAIVDFCCVLQAIERYDKGDVRVGTYWLVAGIALSLLGWTWPQIKRRFTSKADQSRELPENRPRVMPKEYGKDEQLGSHGLFVRNPGYDALEVHIPSVLIDQSMYRLVFPDRMAIFCEREGIRFLEASLQHTQMSSGLGGSSLHKVMRDSGIDHVNFSIFYKDTNFLKFKTNCIIERTNRTPNGLEVRAVNYDFVSDEEWELSLRD